MNLGEERFGSIRSLTKFSNHEEALNLLKKLASHVKPIMKKRNWRVGSLEEFLPADRRLLGINENHGERICIRLRPPYDESRFLDFDSLIGTMLHELTHIVRGPHDASFYQLLDELNDEYDDLLYKGYIAFSNGRPVGEGVSHNVPPALARQKALEAAEKRRKTEGLMTKGGRVLGGRRLGGSNGERNGLSLRELAAMAAERRRRDNVWCGSESKKPTASPTTTRTTRLDVNATTWTCSQCTFINRPMALQCDVCLAEKPHDNDTTSYSPEPVIIVNDDFPDFSEFSDFSDPSDPFHWDCPRCTFKNAPDIIMCLGCDYLKN